MPRNSMAGQILGGRYRVDEMVGQGGMSAVYKAYDPNLKRAVAIKTIHSHLAADPRFLVRFEEEATAVAQLRHPNIAQVFDYTHDGDLYYMVQEFVVGETLQDHLRRLNKAGKRMPLPEVIGITLNTAEAAGYAHRRGMIHRDIKPANIMLDVHGQAILMDFGIVKMTGAERHTASGAVLGTALYMPPEVIQGEVPDGRSDLYSLGVTLFEMVSGRPPFEADSTMALMMMHVRNAPPDLHILRPGVPEPLIAVIGKALAKNRDERYSSMADLAAALKQAQALAEAPEMAGATALEMPQVPVAHAVPGGALPAAGAGTRPAASAGALPTASAGQQVQPAANSGPFRVVETQQTRPAPARPVEVPASRQAVEPVRPRPAEAGRPGTTRPKLSPAVWIGGAVVVLAIVAGVLFALLRSPGKQAELPGATPTTPATALPAGAPFARISGITVDNQQRYVVEYQISGFTAQVAGLHLHFFFDSVPPEQAGAPGAGTWTDYAGSSPFIQIKESDRPATASRLCMLVANADQSVRLNTGTCSILPNVVAAVTLQDTACLSGPDATFPPVAQLKKDQVALVLGLASNQAYWEVTDPKSGETCWLLGENAQLDGDVSKVPTVQGPSQPTGAAPSGLSVEIVHIGIDQQSHYVVQFQTTGFTAQLPGTHIDFFFDTVPPEQVGASGTGQWLTYGGPSPFSGYLTKDRPADAVKMCALVANANNSVVPGSGNCVILPDAP